MDVSHNSNIYHPISTTQNPSSQRLSPTTILNALASSPRLPYFLLKQPLQTPHIARPIRLSNHPHNLPRTRPRIPPILHNLRLGICTVLQKQPQNLHPMLRPLGINIIILDPAPPMRCPQTLECFEPWRPLAAWRGSVVVLVWISAMPEEGADCAR
jgi:hypothetical protein